MSIRIQKEEAFYLGYHIQHIEGLPFEESRAMFKKLQDYCEQPQYVFEGKYRSPTDVVLWDNLLVMHRAKRGKYPGLYKRDMRRFVVLDKSFNPLNPPDVERINTAGILRETHDRVTGSDEGARTKEEVDA